MKKWFILALIVCVSATVHAGNGGGGGGGGNGGGGNGGGGGNRDGKGQRSENEANEDQEISKKQFVKRQREQSRKRDTEFNKTKAEALFDKMDKNSDGVLTGDEKPKNRQGKRNRK